jgi:hypothetical protein
MADAMTSQNIDLSSWDTLYNKLRNAGWILMEFDV